MKEIQVFNDKLEKNNELYTMKAQWGLYENVSVSLKISHDDKNLILFYDVHENEIRKESKFNNDNVYEDSCLECFLKNKTSDEYLNFEISASSFMLVGKGKDKFDRTLFDVNLIKDIKREVNIINEEKNNCHWTLTLFIDLYKWNLIDPNFPIENQSIKGNFYKCGDKLESPHYLSLFEIEDTNINFHVQESFNNLVFI